jgi:peptide/nickel transport system permease protein
MRFSYKRATRNRQFLIGFLIYTLITIIALVANLIAPYPYNEMHIDNKFQPPSLQHLCGTDEYGRDVLSRVLVGSRSSLFMGLAATAISLLLGVPLGLVSGFHGGRVDELVMRVMDIVMSFPPILLGLLILAVTPPSLYKAVLAVGIVYVPTMARVTRSVTLALTEEEFVLSAKASGESSLQIIFREILPNALPSIIVEASLRVTLTILLGAALSFLGVGAQPPSSDWGLMISEARPYVFEAPWIAIFPGTIMCILVIGVNLLGDGLREILDPRLRSRGMN